MDWEKEFGKFMREIQEVEEEDMTEEGEDN